MIARILVGLGGTPSTTTAIRYAVELAQVHRAEILGITVVDRGSALSRFSGNALGALRELDRFDAIEHHQDQSILEFESACAKAGLNYARARGRGDPFESVIPQAMYYDLTVLGLDSLFGNDGVRTDPTYVLSHLITKGVRPILAVSQEYRPIQRVLLAYSGSTESARSIKRFMQMQLWSELSVKVVTFERTPEAAKGLATDVAEYCRAHGQHDEVEHVAGSSAGQQLLQHVRDWNADAIVVGDSGKRLWLKKLLGKPVVYAVRHANVPLFIS